MMNPPDSACSQGEVSVAAAPIRGNVVEQSAQNEIVTPSVKRLRVVELFCGLGGFRIGCNYASTPAIQFDFVYAHDTSEKVKQIYDVNFPPPSPSMICSPLPDIATIPDCDLLVTGIEGQTDATLPYIINIVREKRPCWVIFENDKKYGKDTVSPMESQMQSLRYMVLKTSIDMSKVTPFPQSRERSYIVACNDISKLSRFIMPTTRIQPVRTIQSLLQSPDTIHDKYYYFPGKTIYDTLAQAVTKQGTLYQFRRYYVRENKTERCPTLTANMGRGGHNVPIVRDSKGIRRLTPQECLLFQGFPPEYQIPARIADCHSYTFIGSAIAPPMVQRIVEQICVGEGMPKPDL